MVVRAEHEPDAFVPQQGQMPPGLLDRDGVVARDAGESEVLDRRVHEHDGDLALGEEPVVLMPGVRLGELAAREDHAGHLLLEQQFHVVRLGDAAVGLGAQDGVRPCWASAPPITSANAGKIGFCSSGRTSPTRRARSPRSWVGRS